MCAGVHLPVHMWVCAHVCVEASAFLLLTASFAESGSPPGATGHYFAWTGWASEPWGFGCPYRTVLGNLNSGPHAHTGSSYLMSHLPTHVFTDLFACLVGCFLRWNLTKKPCLAWNSLDRSIWPQTHRSTFFCLLSAGIKVCTITPDQLQSP